MLLEVHEQGTVTARDTGDGTMSIAVTAGYGCIRRNIPLILVSECTDCLRTGHGQEPAGACRLSAPVSVPVPIRMMSVEANRDIGRTRSFPGTFLKEWRVMIRITRISYLFPW